MPPASAHEPSTHRASIAVRLAAPVDAASLVFFRVAFGGVMLWEVWRFHTNGWMARYYSGKELYFSYWPFTGIGPPPEPWLPWILVAIATGALGLVLGFGHRATATLLALSITYLFLLEQARYLNHLYLVVLLCFVLIFTSPHRLWSLDALQRPTLASATVPAWNLWLLRFQLAVPYFFGGVAKLNADWLAGEPLRSWLAARTDFPLLGRYFTDEPVVWAMSYGALLLDLLGPFCLLFRRTRLPTYLLLLIFHFMNARLFGIGIFPWTMMVGTTLFFEPDWPRRLAAAVRERRVAPVVLTGLGLGVGFVLGGFLPTSFQWPRAVIGAVVVGIAGFHGSAAGKPSARRPSAVSVTAPKPLDRWRVALLGSWVVLQCAVPLRHFAIPGNVHWTEEGHRFAWHMKLRDKDARAEFFVRRPATGEEWRVDPRDHLTDRQFEKMCGRPDMLVQFARHLGQLYTERGEPEVEVRALAGGSLNSRPQQLLVDPEVDLTEVPYPWFGHAPWILPLTRSRP